VVDPRINHYRKAKTESRKKRKSFSRVRSVARHEAKSAQSSPMAAVICVKMRIAVLA
jgi:hypothetical protein